ncbi:MAG: HAD family phosphatase [Candidatus Omnitrophica bacterium]|nr:HAD family phosphatase [Candidatus Omnitrophota bacterium]
MSKIKFSVNAVIFDMDGVITNTMPYHFKAWKKIFHEAGVEVSHHSVYIREGQRGLWSVKEIFEEKGRPYQEKEAKRLLKKKEELFKKIVKSRFIQGSRSFLKDLHRKGIRLALVTGTARHEVHKILPEVIYDLFEVVVTGSDVHHGKPHPEPFELALKQLALRPQEAVVIENAPLGIQSARAAGLRCLALATSLPASYLKKANHIFVSMKELQEKTQWVKK